jgi:ribosomal protein L35
VTDARVLWKKFTIKYMGDKIAKQQHWISHIMHRKYSKDTRILWKSLQLSEDLGKKIGDCKYT